MPRKRSGATISADRLAPPAGRPRARKKALGATPRRLALLEGESGILDLIVRDASLAEILQALARNIEDQVASAACCIMLLDGDGTRADRAYGPRFPTSLTAIFDSATPAADSDLWAVDALRQSAIAAGFQSCLTQSIRSGDGRTLGNVNLLYPALRDMCEGDRADLDFFGRIASLAIERDRSAQSLRLADERFTSLAASIPGVVYQRRVSPDGDIRYTYISEGVRDLFGIEPEKVLADPMVLFNRHDPSYAVNFRERLLAASRALELWDVEATIVTRDGEQKFTHAIARPYRQPDGSVLWNGLILDQTRIKKAELAAAATEARTRAAIIESLSQGLVLFDAEDRISTFNSAFLKIYPDLTDFAAVGAGYECIIAAELECEAKTGVDLGDRLRARLDQHKLRHHNFERQLADGRWILVNERRTPDGGAILLHSDISALKQREQERSKLQDQLYRAQKMDAMGRLAGGVAHDFNNLLASMLGNAAFLVEDLPPGSETAEFAKEIVIAGQRAKHLVQQILAFSRQQAVEEVDVDIATVSDEAVQLLRATIPSSISFDVKRQPVKAFVRGNATQLVQVLMNLCVNARDAIGPQHGTITLEIGDDTEPGSDPSRPTSSERVVHGPDGRAFISTGELDPGRRYLRIRVTDSGCGMEASVLGKMFEPFFTTKEVGKGTGLGLAAVHGIVSHYGGIVTCTSKPGHGTTFEIFLPTIDAELATSGTPVTDTRHPGRESILIVDDEKQVSSMLARTLKRLGYSVDCFSSAAEALTAFRRTPDAWALAITDQTMPQMTGAEFAEKILAEQSNFPVILCSGYTDAVTAESAAAAGIKAFLTKPVDNDVIARTVRDLLDRRCG